MLRWLSGVRHRSQTVTDDPLAALALNSPQCHVYAVSRVNPIFVEDDEQESGKQAVASSSSGYASHRSDASSGGLSERVRLGEEGVAILEQNTAFVRSILVSTRGCNRLTPIPEGKVKEDYCIPRPVWPRYEDRQRLPPAVHAEDTLLLRLDPSGGSMAPLQSAVDVLRELSHKIDLVVQSRDVPAAEHVLRSLSETINSRLEAIRSEESLRRLSRNLSRSETVVTVGRALKEDEAGRAQLLKRLGRLSHQPEEEALRRFSQSEAAVDRAQKEDLAGRAQLLKRLGRLPHHPELLYSQGSTSSSSSGFSDLTPTPTSSSNDNRAPSASNSVLYQCQSASSVGGAVYEKLGPPPLPSQEVTQPCWPDFHSPEPPAEPLPKAETDCYGFSVCRGLDFTLDVHQAQLLMKKLKAGKRQRCWCRIITSFLGLFFFLVSVMVVSLLLTRGKRIFGSL